MLAFLITVRVCSATISNPPTYIYPHTPTHTATSTSTTTPPFIQFIRTPTTYTQNLAMEMIKRGTLSPSNPSHHDDDLGKLLRFTPSEERMMEQRKLRQREREAAALATLLEREKEQFQRLLMPMNSSAPLLLLPLQNTPKPPSPPFYFYDFFAPADDYSRVHVLDFIGSPSQMEPEKIEPEAYATGKTTRKKRKRQHGAHHDHDHEARPLRLLHKKSLKKPATAPAEQNDSLQPGPPTPPQCDLVNPGPLSSEGKGHNGSKIIIKWPRLAFEEGAGMKKNKKQKKQQQVMSQQPLHPEPSAHPLLPEQLRAFIQKHGGLVSEAKLVIEKVLTATDIARSQARLSLPLLNLTSPDFLTAAEKTLLDGRDESNHPNAIDVPLLQLPSNILAQIKLKKWEMRKEKSSSYSYVLCHTWNHVVNHNGFKQGQFIQIWSFRIGADSTLRLAILRIN